MPRKADKDLKTESGLYKSNLKAAAKYDKSIEKIMVRLPKGYKALMQEHVNQIDKYTVKGKEQHSVNAWIVDLVERELGL